MDYILQLQSQKQLQKQMLAFPVSLLDRTNVASNVLFLTEDKEITTHQLKAHMHHSATKLSAQAGTGPTCNNHSLN